MQRGDWSIGWWAEGAGSFSILERAVNSVVASITGIVGVIVIIISSNGSRKRRSSSSSAE